MNDISHCPICNNKLRTTRSQRHLFLIGKTANWAERICPVGTNHFIQIFTDEDTNEVNFIKVSLDHKYSKFIEVDFYNKKNRISCMKEGKPEYLEIPRLMDLDFPTLEKLKERVALYVIFS